MELDLEKGLITDYGDAHLHDEWRFITPKPVEGDYSQFSGQGQEQRWLNDRHEEINNE